MLCWLHAVPDKTIAKISKFAAGGWARMVASEDAHADASDVLSDAHFRMLVADVGSALFELADGLGAPLVMTVSGTRYDLREYFARNSGKRLERHGVVWALEMALEQVVRAGGRERFTLQVPVRSESFFRHCSELSETLTCRRVTAALEMVPMTYGSRSSLRVFERVALAALAKRAKSRRPDQVVEAIRADNTWLSDTPHFNELRQAQTLNQKLVEHVGRTLELDCGLIARTSSEDQTYE